VTTTASGQLPSRRLNDSDARRATGNNWNDTVLLSRLNDKRAGCIILTMQRLHEYDLVGHVLEQEACEVAGPSGVRTSGPPESSGSGETGGGVIWGSGEDLRRRSTASLMRGLVQAASVWRQRLVLIRSFG
jgi:hypothetical protein